MFRYIGRAELLVLMTRMASAITNETPSENDIDFVLKKCDMGAAVNNFKGQPKGPNQIDEAAVSDGSIDRSEMLPVISLWKTVLIERMKGVDPVPPPGFVEPSKSCFPF